MWVYLIVNALMILIWGMTVFGYFWPGWALAVWVVHLIVGAREWVMAVWVRRAGPEGACCWWDWVYRAPARLSLSCPTDIRSGRRDSTTQRAEDR